MKIHPGQRLKTLLKFTLGHGFYLTSDFQSLFFEFEGGTSFKALSDIHQLAQEAGYDMLVVPFDEHYIRVHLESRT